MVVLSLFDGISCGYQALKELGISIDAYYASEIDKYAIEVSNKNHPDIIQLGDINGWKNWNIDFSKIDMVIGGSPCQGFTFAGKRLNFDDERSKLFFVYNDILKAVKEVNPDVLFLLENVKMQKAHERVIDEFMGVEGIHLNSNRFSAQNRDRIYWTNIPVDLDIVDNCDTLNDILRVSDDYDERLYLSKKHLEGFLRSYNWKANERDEKSKPLLASYYKQPPHCPYVIHGRGEIGRLSEYRRLSPVECERLQGLPDDYTLVVNEKGKENSWTQRYKMIGNGWTVPTIKHLFKNLKKI